MVQIFGIQFRCGTSNANQLLANLCSAILVIGILSFTIWQIVREGRYRRESKFIIVMICLIVLQCSVILLATTAWSSDIDWKQSMSELPGYGVYHLTLFVASGTIFLTFLWILLQYLKPHFEKLKESIALTEYRVLQSFALLLVIGTTFFYINQHPGAKSYDTANPTRAILGDWKAYMTMLDSDAFSMKIQWNNFYSKNVSVLPVYIPRTSSVDIANMVEMDGKTSIVFYTHKSEVTNQILDRYYYMNLYDKNGNLISSVRQINSDAERLFIGFYLENGISDIGHVEFTHEDGSPAFVDGLEICYQ